MKGHVYCIVYRPVGSVCKLQGVQERVSNGFEMAQHNALKRLNLHKGQGDGSVVIKSCGPCFFADQHSASGWME